ncbi:MAG: ATP-binding protein [Candidatus Manganitrophus sp.]|nr:ATP-binding protein [Candidatus Manganitrophus sp.]MDC4227169.1 ATP-binding protein [Candidatus Manganitrophus sp.]WDT71434.1 MAG: ATP-binding protein [Candidatus Manganitrophus sp.]WDT81233.1 MAG: ATP-binding protein [Candidatus Manganitrophus sp.]
MQQGIHPKDYPVLFVDDEEMALISLEEQYEREFTIYTAKSGKEAIETLQAHPEIALIISDQRMPGMSGVEFLAQAKKIVPEAVRMLLTAYTEMEMVIEAINKGNIYRYITKPYDVADLRCAMLQGIEHYYLIRERDRLYAEKIETLKRVARTNRLTAIGTLAAGMAHEINNPMVAIYTFLQMLPQKLKEPQLDKEYLEKFYSLSIREAERIQTLIRKLLDFSKNGDQDELIFKESQINLILQEVVSLLKHEANKKETTIDLQLASDIPLAKIDSEKIRQVFLNLILNAIHATRSGKITATSSFHQDAQGQGYLQVAVADTGAGISEENLEKLFNPFFTTKDAQGTGLGLMICHHIIDQHRGNIDVQSKLGKGTTMTVQIPVDPTKHERRKSERRTEP